MGWVLHFMAQVNWMMLPDPFFRRLT